ncbi:MAG: hypothetical protein B7Z75_12465 [Acidocella sp. 20-57-95]|nr:MAG: hypothetical protein B7Z75_12465 [Acidocella sp. 20-57-95]OYV58259.1 MAG: hypothetical protein B7Z71_10725 [Acidocella sp. 21-58-7]HQT65554.1 hypothetical protein [Acidocella sp.]HQU04324.1 hypothetical protein [Acidocella sp.]
MAFTLRNLSVLAYANGFTLWHYKSGTDKLAQATREGYFADAADLLAPGDMVMLSAAEGGKIATIAGQGKSITLAPLC